VWLAACGSPKHPIGGDGGGDGPGGSADAAIDAPADARPDAPPDAPAGPCALPALTLHAATLAGCSMSGTDNGTRDLSRFANPVNVAVAATGIVYVADFDSSRIRAIDEAGTTTTLVSRNDLKRPFGMVVAPNGTLYVETDDDDLGHHSTSTGTIWAVDTATGNATVIVRDIGRPRGLAVLSDGRLALADHVHHVVELLDPGTGTVSLLAGTLDTPGHINANGASAEFAEPYDVVVLGSDLIVSDFAGHWLRRVTLAGDVTDFAGTGTAGHTDDVLAAAAFSQPKGLAVDGAGTIYVTELGNHDVRAIASGAVTTLAGSLTAGWHDDDDRSLAQFYGIEGIDVTADGSRVIVADGNVGDGTAYNHVRVIH
jgi:DNA-binding beta-propeller fold protein YncE